MKLVTTLIASLFAVSAFAAEPAKKEEAKPAAPAATAPAKAEVKKVTPPAKSEAPAVKDSKATVPATK